MRCMTVNLLNLTKFQHMILEQNFVRCRISMCDVFNSYIFFLLCDFLGSWQDNYSRRTTVPIFINLISNQLAEDVVSEFFNRMYILPSRSCFYMVRTIMTVPLCDCALITFVLSFFLTQFLSSAQFFKNVPLISISLNLSLLIWRANYFPL